MAAVVSEQYVLQQEGAEAIVFGTITLDTSYPTGGSAIDTTGSVDFTRLVVSGGPVSCKYDLANKKLLCYGTAVSASGLTEIANAVNLSGIVADFVGVRPN
jgi:hypothetical protein